jgi:enduracididine beta-hydroxylase
MSTHLDRTSSRHSAFELSAKEASEIDLLLDDLCAKYNVSTDPEFLDSAAYHAKLLPVRLRTFLLDFKLKNPRQTFCTLSGFSINEQSLVPTPPHWSSASSLLGTVKPSMYLVLVGSLLGEPFGWATKQNGATILDVLPIPSDENLQISSSSVQELICHTEDAFQTDRCRYLILLCLRNPDSVATTIASIADVELSSDDVELLFAPNFTILPEYSHKENNNPNPPKLGAASGDVFSRIRVMTDEPEFVSVLFGERSRPCIRVDPVFRGPSRSAEAESALERLITALDAALKPVVLCPGEILILNNLMAVHGRQPFNPRYDGSDRWLKRLLVRDEISKSLSRIPGTRLLCSRR